MNMERTEREQQWIGERMHDLSVKERLQLDAALLRTGAKTPMEIIQCLLTIQDYEVISDVGSYSALGKYYMEQELHLPKDAMNYVDVEELGRVYENHHPGVFLEGKYYVAYPQGEVQAPCTGQPSDLPQDQDWSIKLKLASKMKPDGVWLRLPDGCMQDVGDASGEVELTLRELGERNLASCTLLEAKCILPQIQDLMEQYDDIEELVWDGNNLGFVLEERGQGMPNFMERLMAALDLENCHDLRLALDISQNLRCYDTVKTADLEEYAKQELKDQGFQGGACPGVDLCIDYMGYGEKILVEQGYRLDVDQSLYIRRNEQDFYYERSQKPDNTMTIQM